MDKVQKKWNKRKKKRQACPNCYSYDIHLNRSINRTFNRYWLECFSCHWCASRANTIRGAIRKWNSTKWRKKVSGKE